MLLTLTLGISPRGFLHSTGIFEGVIESHFSSPLDSEPMEKQYTRIKDPRNGVLAEKAGLKTWLGSKAKRKVFSSPQGLKVRTGPRAGSSGTLKRRTRQSWGRGGGGSADNGWCSARSTSCTLPTFPRKTRKKGPSPLGRGPLFCRDREEWGTQACLPTDCWRQRERIF